MSDGDEKVKQCSNCGEVVYLVDTEDVELCHECGGVVHYFSRRD